MSEWSSAVAVAADVAIVSGFTALGDFLEQRKVLAQGDAVAYKVQRTKNQAIAAVPIGVAYHFWYQWLDGTFPSSTSASVVGLKVFLDIFLMSPLLWTFYFAVLTLVVEGGSWRKFRYRAFHQGLKLWLAEWVIWPPLQALNFVFLPTRLRVLCDMAVQLVFDAYASFLLHDDEDQGPSHLICLPETKL